MQQKFVLQISLLLTIAFSYSGAVAYRRPPRRPSVNGPNFSITPAQLLQTFSTIESGPEKHHKQQYRQISEDSAVEQSYPSVSYETENRNNYRRPSLPQLPPKFIPLDEVVNIFRNAKDAVFPKPIYHNEFKPIANPYLHRGVEPKYRKPAPPPPPVYGPPNHDYLPPKKEYGPPKQEYGPPKQEYGPPKQEYGPPQEPRPESYKTISPYASFPSSTQSPKPKLNYYNNYHLPQLSEPGDSYGLPQQSSSEENPTPPSEIVEEKPESSHNPSSTYGPPVATTPSPTYGTPTLSPTYGPPPTLSPTYGPPPSSTYTYSSPTYSPPTPTPETHDFKHKDFLYGVPSAPLIDEYIPSKDTSTSYGIPSAPVIDEYIPSKDVSTSYGQPSAPVIDNYIPDSQYGPQPPSDKREIRFIIHKPGDEEIVKSAVIEDAKHTGDQISFVKGPDMDINHKQKIYLPPPKKTIIYVLIKEPQIKTTVQVMEAKPEDIPKPEVFVIYESANGVIKKHYDLSPEEGQKVANVIADKIRSTRESSEESNSSSNEATSEDSLISISTSTSSSISVSSSSSNSNSNNNNNNNSEKENKI